MSKIVLKTHKWFRFHTVRTVPWDHCEIPRCLLQFSQDSSRERAKNMDEDEKFDLILKFREMVRFYLTSVFDEYLILIY